MSCNGILEFIGELWKIVEFCSIQLSAFDVTIRRLVSAVAYR